MDFDELLRQHVTQDEPPLGLTSVGMVRAAKHRQRLRAVVGAATVGTAVTLIGTLTLAAPGAPPNGFADPEPSACTSALRTTGPTPQPSEFLPPLDLPRPLPSTFPVLSPSEGTNVYVDPSAGVSDAATPSPWFPPATSPPPSETVVPSHVPSTVPEESFQPVPTPSTPPEFMRLTCHLVASVGRIAPVVTSEHAVVPLTVYESKVISGGHAARAVLLDDQGYGLLEVHVGLRMMAVPPDAEKCRLRAACQAKQGPNGEQIEVYTSTEGGRVAYTLYVWSGDTFILVTADNNAQRPAPFRPTPFFTVDQLIEIACHPTMKLY